MLLTTAISLYIPLAEKDLLDKGLMEKNFRVILIYLFILFIIKFIQELISAAQDQLSTYVSNKYTYNITKNFFRNLLKFPISFFEKYNIGEITNRINGDVVSISILVDHQLVSLITDMLTLIGIIFVMAKLNMTMFLISLLAVPVIVITNNKIAKEQKKATKKMKNHNDRKSKTLQEMILGIKEVKYLNIFKWAEREFAKSQNSILREKMKINKIVLIFFIISSRLYEIIHTSVYIIGAYILVKGDLTVGALFAFLTYFTRAISIVERLTGFNVKLQRSLVSIDRVYEVLKYGQASKKDNKQTAINKFNNGYKISFNNVDFSYTDNSEVLKNINFNITKGEKVALIGENGSGKSTIMSLLMKIIEPDKGSITCDNKDISSLTWKQLTDKISYVPQSLFLFNYTIRENLKLGNKDATDKEIYQVLGQVGMLQFIDNLENGLDTILTLSGSNVSGGQLQRLAIARALLRKKEILLLDESTSSIEENFEEQFIKNLVKQYKDLTVIMIMHKEKLTKYFDKILKIKDKNIYEKDVTKEEVCNVYKGENVI